MGALRPLVLNTESYGGGSQEECASDARPEKITSASTRRKDETPSSREFGCKAAKISQLDSPWDTTPAHRQTARQAHDLVLLHTRVHRRTASLIMNLRVETHQTGALRQYKRLEDV